MKQVLVVIGVASLLLNGFAVYTEYLGGDGGSEWLSSDGDDKEETLEDLTVQVPAFKYDDMATYDYLIFAEMYWEDYESGNWSLYRLTVNGNLRHQYHPEAVERRDGFWEKHKSVWFEMDTQASFELFFDSHDAEPLTIEGSLDGERHEYTDLKDKKVINTHTEGDVEIDRLPKAPIPLSYSGMIDAFPNPSRVVAPSLDEQIYGQGQQIKLKDNGTITQEMFYEEYDKNIETLYNWSADRASIFKGYKTLHVNVTAEIFFGMMDFNEQIWISNDIPFPIKRMTKTNQTFEDEDGIFWIVIQTTNTLQENSFIGGRNDIPWGTGTSIWHKTHPKGEFKDWNYIPVAGTGFSASSFDFKTEDADQYARQHSAGLQNFLQTYDNSGRGVTITYAGYNASKSDTDINSKAGSYRWNLTYGYSPTWQEREDARETGDWNFTYNIVLIKNVTKDPLKPLQNEYIEVVEVEYDWGLRRDAAPKPKEYMTKKALTLASSEDIMMLHPKVKEAVGDRNDEIEWGDFDTTYGILNAGVGAGSEGMMLVELLTGIQMPSADYAWALQQGTVYESGDTFSAAVDAENGQLVYIMEISGSDLIGAFD